MLLTILQYVLIFSGFVPTLLGLFIIFHIARPQHSPADTSNRINKIRLLWFALTREEKFVGVMPWLRHDESNNVDRN